LHTDAARFFLRLLRSHRGKRGGTQRRRTGRKRTKREVGF
jgi:hypothetical protein